MIMQPAPCRLPGVGSPFETRLEGAVLVAFLDSLPVADYIQVSPNGPEQPIVRREAYHGYVAAPCQSLSSGLDVEHRR
jgi:hypothetical protein